MSFFSMTRCETRGERGAREGLGSTMGSAGADQETINASPMISPATGCSPKVMTCRGDSRDEVEKYPDGRHEESNKRGNITSIIYILGKLSGVLQCVEEEKSISGIHRRAGSRVKRMLDP